MDSNDNRVYYNLLSRVGNEGPYQRKAMCIFVLIGIVTTSTFFVNPYLFYQQPYICRGQQSSSCNRYVCSLPPAQRKQFEAPITVTTLGNYRGDYMCDPISVVSTMNEVILIGAGLGVVVVLAISDALGKKKTVFYALIMAVVGVLITVLAPLSVLKDIGLVIWGAGADIAFAVAAGYITEVVSER
jgi:MFS family permease